MIAVYEPSDHIYYLDVKWWLKNGLTPRTDTQMLGVGQAFLLLGVRYPDGNFASTREHARDTVMMTRFRGAFPPQKLDLVQFRYPEFLDMGSWSEETYSFYSKDKYHGELLDAARASARQAVTRHTISELLSFFPQPQSRDFCYRLDRSGLVFDRDTRDAILDVYIDAYETARSTRLRLDGILTY